MSPAAAGEGYILAPMSNNDSPSLLDRFLRLFADVRAGEGITALLLSSNIFLLLASYYIIKAIRDGLILGEFGANAKSYTSAGAVFLLAIVVPLYGKLADRLPRRRLINIVTMFFVASFIGFYGLWASGLNIGIVFYAWVAVFNVMIIAQFWSFANDVYTKPEGERLFPIVAFGQSLGAVVGASYVASMAGSLGIGMLLLTGAALLFAQVQVTNYVDRRERRLKEADLPKAETTGMMTATGTMRIEDIEKLLSRAQGEDVHLSEADDDAGAAPRAPEEAPDEAKKGGGETTGAFALVFRTRYLLMIGLLMMLLNLVNTTGEYILDRAMIDAAVAVSGATEGAAFTQQITILKASFFGVVNVAGLLIQLFVVSRVVQFFGVGIGLMIRRIISLGG